LGFDTRAYISGDKQGTFGSSFIESGKDEVYFQGSNLEVSIPLWQGFLGKSLELEKSKVLSQSKAENSIANYQKQQLIVEAELSYLRLSKIQNEIEILQELVKQGERLASYAGRKVEQRLLEVTNLKESQAALSARPLQLESKIAEKTNVTKEFLSFIQANNLQEQYEVESLDWFP
jgi:outer membrane protein TolC